MEHLPLSFKYVLGCVRGMGVQSRKYLYFWIEDIQCEFKYKKYYLI